MDKGFGLAQLLKKDKDRRTGKGRRFCLGGRSALAVLRRKIYSTVIGGIALG